MLYAFALWLFAISELISTYSSTYPKDLLYAELSNDRRLNVNMKVAIHLMKSKTIHELVSPLQDEYD